MNLHNRFKSVFEPSLIIEIEKEARSVSLKEGESFIEFGQTIRFMPMVVAGALKISRIGEDGQELLLYYIKENESCALSFTCCMQQSTSEINAIAEEDTDLLAIPSPVMGDWLVNYPTWRSFAMNTIRSRFNELVKSIEQIAFHKLDERLINYLRDKSKATGSSLVNQSHEKIATDLATSRVVVSRLLKKLEHDKKVLLYRNQIKLLKDL